MTVVKPVGQMSTYEVTITVVTVTGSEVEPEGAALVGAGVTPDVIIVGPVGVYSGVEDSDPTTVLDGTRMPDEDGVPGTIAEVEEVEFL